MKYFLKSNLLSKQSAFSANIRLSDFKMVSLSYTSHYTTRITYEYNFNINSNSNCLEMFTDSDKIIIKYFSQYISINLIVLFKFWII